jgi:hypothetical protein
MLQLITAVRFARRMSSGRTSPALMGCELVSGEEIEVIVKLSGTDCGLSGIVREAIMAMLAADLALPVAEPYLVVPVDGFIDALPSGELLLATQMRRSVFPTFGARKLPAGFAIWGKNRELKDALVDQAAEILAFDALTLNPDRRVGNPNCQCDGMTFAIFDHEYGLCTQGLGTALLPRPWDRDGLRALTAGAGEHALYRALWRRGAELHRLQAAWQDLPGKRLEEYRASLPPEWTVECAEIIDEALMYLQELHHNLEQAFAEVRRVLA